MHRLFEFEHRFGNENPDYIYSKWWGIERLWANRIVTPVAFLPALELYKVLLGAAWYDDRLWPEWLLKECHDSGMHLDQIDWHTVLWLERNKGVVINWQLDPSPQTK